MKNPLSALGELKARRDAEFTEYVAGRMAAWRRVGYLSVYIFTGADVTPYAIAIFAHHLLFTGLTYSRRRA